MKICLIDTAAVTSKRLLPHWTPLGLAYIAAALEQEGHTVTIIERDVLFRRNRLNLDRVERLTANVLKRFQPDMVGISSTTELFADAVRTARLVKQLLPDIPVVYGGHHASALPVAILVACPQMDIVVKGQGEITMVELANGLPLANIQGIYYRNGKKVVHTDPREPVLELDQLPMPARHLLDMNFYTRSTFTQIRHLTCKTTTMLTSRGCPFHCAFCVESLPAGRTHRFHSASRVMDELEAILTRYPVEAVYFIDDGFLSHASRVAELCGLMIQQGVPKRLKWCAQVRVDAMDKKLLALMRQAGCVELECGFETTSDALLQSVGKGIRSRDNLQVIRDIHHAGIRCAANIVYGLPGETRQDFDNTVDFIKTSGVETVNFQPFCPYPGSLLYLQLVAQGRLKENFWQAGENCFEGLNFTRMSDDLFNTCVKKAWNEVIQPINTRDRMRHTTPWQRLQQISMEELAAALLKTPLNIPRFFTNWWRTRSADRRS